MYHSKTALAAGITGIFSGVLLVAYHVIQAYLKLIDLPAYADVNSSLGLEMLSYTFTIYSIGLILCWIGFGTRSRICMLAAAVIYFATVFFASFEFVVIAAILIPAILSLLSSLRWMENNACDWLGFHGRLEDHVDEIGRAVTPKY